MIINWLFDGEFVDKYNEFLIIKGKVSVKVEKETGKPEWGMKYKLNNKMKLSIIPEKLANDILLVGKNINYIRFICNDKRVCNRVILVLYG